MVVHTGYYQIALRMGRSLRTPFMAYVKRNGQVVGAFQGIDLLSESFMVTADAFDVFEMYTDAIYFSGPGGATAYSLSIVQLA